MNLQQYNPPSMVLNFRQKAGASLYEAALVASLFALIGIIVLIALA